MIKGIVLSIIFGWKVREEKEKIKKKEKKITRQRKERDPQ